MGNQASIREEAGLIVLTVPFCHRQIRRTWTVQYPPDDPRGKYAARTAITIALGRGFIFRQLLDSGRFATLTAIANHIGEDLSIVAHMHRLTLLAPDIIDALIDGRGPEDLALQDLYKELPLPWSEQRTLLGFPESGRAPEMHAAPPVTPAPALPEPQPAPATPVPAVPVPRESAPGETAPAETVQVQAETPPSEPPEPAPPQPAVPQSEPAKPTSKETPRWRGGRRKKNRKEPGSGGQMSLGEFVDDFRGARDDED